MTAEEFIRWRESLGLSRSGAAELLGISPNGYTRYENGSPIPRHITLACTAIAYGLGPWQETVVPKATSEKTAKRLREQYGDKRFADGYGKVRDRGSVAA